MATIQYIVNAIDSASATFTRIAGSADQLNDKLDKLSHKSATARVGLDGDAKAKTSLDDIDLKMARLSDKLAKPKITLEGQNKALLDIAALNLALDKLNHKQVSPDIDTGGLSRLIGGKTGGGGLLGLLLGEAKGGAGGGGGGGAALGGLAGPAAIGIGVALAGALLPALIPVTLGLLTGGGAAAGAFAIGSQAEKKLLPLQKQLTTAQAAQAKTLQQLATATGAHAKTLQATATAQAAHVAALQSQIAAINKSSGGFIDVYKIGTGALHNLYSAFQGALTGRGAPEFVQTGPSPGVGHRGGVIGTSYKEVQAPSFLQGLSGILAQVSGWIKTIGPGLGDLFRASLPFLQMFVKSLEQLASTLLPVITQSLKDFTPYLPQISKGFLAISQGLAGFLQALGPGMKASSQIFLAVAKTISWVLEVTGHVFSWLAISIDNWAKRASNNFNFFRHDTAAAFDRVRHDVAAAWDMTWNNTIGRAQRGLHDVASLFDAFRHGTAMIFDGLRGDIAGAWNTIWNNTIGRIQRGISDAVGWFKGAPRRFLNAMGNAGSLLYGWGKDALSGIVNGAKAIWHTVSSWFSGLPGAILHALGIHSPPDWAISAGGHIMQGLLKGLTGKPWGALKGFMTGLASDITGPLKSVWNTLGGGLWKGSWGGAQVASWIKQAMQVTGAPGSWLPLLEKLVGLESGGNPSARNLSPAGIAAGYPEGIAQVTIGTFNAMSLPGHRNPWNPVDNLIAGIRHIMESWGTIYNIPGLGRPGPYGGYDEGGLLMPGTTMVINKTGSAETVIPGAKLDAMIGLLGEIAAQLGLLGEIAGNTAAAAGAGIVAAGPSRASIGWGYRG